LQQTATTSDKKGEMRSIANYLSRDQDTKQGAQLANQIQLELRPKPGQSLDANTVREFQVEVERISELRRGTVQVDPSNPKEFNAILMPQPQAQAPVQVQQAAAAAVVVPKQPENPLPVQEKQSFRRASRMPPPIPLSRQKSIGELESFSPRDNQSDSAKSNPTLEKMPTSENLLKQVDEMTEKIFESPRGEGASSAEKNPVIQRLQSESVKVKSASAASVQDARSTLPSPGKK
jgi:hypothetical protein